MLKLLIDTNIIIDYLHMRQPFFQSARKLIILGYTHVFDLWLTSSQMTDLVYILTEGGKQSLIRETLSQLRKLRQIINVYATSENEVDKMLLTDWRDPEDFLLYQCALALSADAIITHNFSNFEEQIVKVCNCEELINWVNENSSVRYSLEKLRVLD